MKVLEADVYVLLMISLLTKCWPIAHCFHPGGCLNHAENLQRVAHCRMPHECQYEVVYDHGRTFQGRGSDLSVYVVDTALFASSLVTASVSCRKGWGKHNSP
jgi:hypothetical protein